MRIDFLLELDAHIDLGDKLKHMGRRLLMQGAVKRSRHLGSPALGDKRDLGIYIGGKFKAGLCRPNADLCEIHPPLKGDMDPDKVARPDPVLGCHYLAHGMFA